jgi:hypothetical protein
VHVLHEIPPSEWLELFDNTSLIGRSLKDSGCLVIVEDQRIPIGEKAHKFGFLVLDTEHLSILFSVTKEDCDNGLFQVFDQRDDDRLKAHKISKQLFNRLQPKTRDLAIQELCKTAKLEITALREKKPIYLNGLLHGFWTQQFVNASLWLDKQRPLHGQQKLRLNG